MGGCARTIPGDSPRDGVRRAGDRAHEAGDGVRGAGDGVRGAGPVGMPVRRPLDREPLDREAENREPPDREAAAAPVPVPVQD